MASSPKWLPGFNKAEDPDQYKWFSPFVDKLDPSYLDWANQQKIPTSLGSGVSWMYDDAAQGYRAGYKKNTTPWSPSWSADTLSKDVGIKDYLGTLARDGAGTYDLQTIDAWETAKAKQIADIKWQLGEAQRYVDEFNHKPNASIGEGEKRNSSVDFWRGELAKAENAQINWLPQEQGGKLNYTLPGWATYAYPGSETSGRWRADPGKDTSFGVFDAKYYADISKKLAVLGLTAPNQAVIDRETAPDTPTFNPSALPGMSVYRPGQSYKLVTHAGFPNETLRQLENAILDASAANPTIDSMRIADQVTEKMFPDYAWDQLPKDPDKLSLNPDDPTIITDPATGTIRRETPEETAKRVASEKDKAVRFSPYDTTPYKEPIDPRTGKPFSESKYDKVAWTNPDDTPYTKVDYKSSFDPTFWQTQYDKMFAPDKVAAERKTYIGGVEASLLPGFESTLANQREAAVRQGGMSSGLIAASQIEPTKEYTRQIGAAANTFEQNKMAEAKAQQAKQFDAELLDKENSAKWNLGQETSKSDWERTQAANESASEANWKSGQLLAENEWNNRTAEESAKSKASWEQSEEYNKAKWTREQTTIAIGQDYASELTKEAFNRANDAQKERDAIELKYRSRKDMTDGERADAQFEWNATYQKQTRDIGLAWDKLKTDLQLAQAAGLANKEMALKWEIAILESEWKKAESDATNNAAIWQAAGQGLGAGITAYNSYADREQRRTSGTKQKD